MLYSDFKVFAKINLSLGLYLMTLVTPVSVEI